MGCAVAPIPTANSYDEYLETIRFGRAHDAFQRFQDADFATAAFKALVIADDELVDELIAAFEELRARKERIEKVVMALKPLLGAEEAAAVDVASTLQRMLLDIADVGADLTFLPGSVAGMTVLVGEMTLSGA